MTRLGFALLTSLAMLTGAASAHARLLQRGGSFAPAGDGALVCAYFGQQRPAAAPKAHGFVCGLVDGSPTPTVGPALVVALRRNGQIRCAEQAALLVEGSFTS